MNNLEPSRRPEAEWGGPCAVGNCQRSALSSGRMSHPSDWPAAKRPLPVTFHRTHNAEQGSLAAKIWGIECSFWERCAVGPLGKRGTPDVVIARTSPKTEIYRVKMTVIMMDRSSGPRLSCAQI